MQVRMVFLIIGSLLLFGCAATPKFSEAEFPRSHADLEIVAVQQEIETRPSQTNPGAAGGGLLGVLIASAIDNSNNTRADNAVMPIRDLLIDYSVGDRFAEKVQASGIAQSLVLDTDPVLRADEVVVSEVVLDRPLMVIRPWVHFQNDMSALLVDLRVFELLPNERGGHPRRGFAQSYHFIWPLDFARRLSRDEAAERWSEWSRDDLVALIERGMDETLMMLAANLEQQVLVFDDPNTRIRIPEPGSYRLWRESGDLRWVSSRPDGPRIFAVPDHAIR